MFAHRLGILCSISALVLVTACSSNRPRDDSVGGAADVAISATQYGSISSIDLVPVASRSSGGGAVLGAVLGAVIGNQVGSGNGRAAATGLGAVGGALIGNNIEMRRKSESEIYRVGVRYDNGRLGQFDYQRIDDLQVGDRVRVEGGLLHRV
jgi:outer membrane lipoprotein SlyB